jgi:ethanolamine transporter EutH
MMSRLSVLGDMLAFFAGRRKFWLLPLVIALLVVGVLVVFAATSAIAPLIYPLF